MGRELFEKQAQPSTTPEDGEKYANYAMFFAGLKILQTMNLCFAGSFPVLLRFGLPPQQIGPFIGITGSCLNFGAAMGDITGFFLGLLNMASFFFPAGFSVLTTILLFLIQCRLTRVCLRCHGYDGVRKYFYWLCFSAFIYQGDALLCTATWGFQSAWLFFALEITNVLIPVVHWIAWVFFHWCGGKDILFWKLCFQSGSMVILTFVCVVVWIVIFIGCCPKKGCKGDANNAGKADPAGSNNCQANSATDLAGSFKTKSNGGLDNPNTWGIRCLYHKNTQAALDCCDRVNPNGDPTKIVIVSSPFFMGLLGMGSIFWLFPVIFPFMVCNYSHFEFTQKLNLALGAVATLIVWCINEVNKGSDGEFKMSGKTFGWWKFHDWSDGLAGLWNLAWLIFLPVGFFTWMFFQCLHSPSGYFARCILYSRWAVICGCTFFLVSQLFKAFGLNGVFMNAIVTAGITALGNISFMLSMIHLTASLFTTQAYSVGYGSFKTAVNSGCSWPTQGLGGFRSYLWWHSYSIRNGTKTFFGLWKIDIVAVIS